MTAGTLNLEIQPATKVHATCSAVMHTHRPRFGPSSITINGGKAILVARTGGQGTNDIDVDVFKPGCRSSYMSGRGLCMTSHLATLTRNESLTPTTAIFGKTRSNETVGHESNRSSGTGVTQAMDSGWSKIFFRIGSGTNGRSFPMDMSPIRVVLVPGTFKFSNFKEELASF